MRIVKLTEENKKDLLNKLLKRSTQSYPEYEKTVADIIYNVRTNGDSAVFEYTRKFDKYELTSDNIKVTRAEIDAAYEELDKD